MLRFVTVAVAILGVAAAASCTSGTIDYCTGCPKHTCTIINQFKPKTADKTGECCSACLTNPKCSFWTMNHGTGKCNIKNGAEQGTQHPGNCTGGLGPAPLSPTPGPSPAPPTPPLPTPPPLPPTVCPSTQATQPPNILFIVGDDFGWTDVSYHDGEIPTRNMDHLAAEGLKLEAHYVMPVCTPTRSAFMSSRYPIRTGLQVSTISPAKPYGLHFNFSTLADELRAVGYKTHGIGSDPSCPPPLSLSSS
jgi:hypothetical protein